MLYANLNDRSKVNRYPASGIKCVMQLRGREMSEREAGVAWARAKMEILLGADKAKNERATHK